MDLSLLNIYDNIGRELHNHDAWASKDLNVALVRAHGKSKCSPILNLTAQFQDGLQSLEVAVSSM